MKTEQECEKLCNEAFMGLINTCAPRNPRDVSHIAAKLLGTALALNCGLLGGKVVREVVMELLDEHYVHIEKGAGVEFVLRTRSEQ